MPHAPWCTRGRQVSLCARLNFETADGIGWLGMMNRELLSRADLETTVVSRPTEVIFLVSAQRGDLITIAMS